MLFRDYQILYSCCHMTYNGNKDKEGDLYEYEHYIEIFTVFAEESQLLELGIQPQRIIDFEQISMISEYRQDQN